MEASKRIRLVFRDDDILSESQKSDGLNRSWVLLKPHQHDTVSDVASLLLDAFQLRQSCPHGLLLSVSGFVFPPFESTCILKDNEIISVRKRRDALYLEGNNAPGEVGELEAVDKQPVNSNVLLLANEEFEKEKGGYESDEPEEDVEEELHIENPRGETADPSHRKRKAAEKLKGSKRKKQRSEASECVANKVHSEKTENALQHGDRSQKNGPSSEEKYDNLIAEDNVEEESAKSSDGNHDSVTGMKRNDEVKEDGKENKDAKKDPKEHKKLPSRSARRKYVKRRWLKEMKKIQKQNLNCESESLRNWKEDQAKAKRQKVEKGPKKWEKQQADAERNDDGQPKGLLHWMQSPQDNTFVKGKKRGRQNQNTYFNMHSRNKDIYKQRSHKSDGHELSKQQEGNVPEIPGQTSGTQEGPNKNGDTSEQPKDDSGKENEVVPVVIRPGHIRFEPLDEDVDADADADAEQAVQKEHVPLETFQWNGITSKKKGQKWGLENHSFTPRNDAKNSKKVNSEVVSNEKEKQLDEVDFDKLPLLTTMPKEDDLIAYRILELSSSWTPELSDFRVGKVSWCDTESNQILLMPVPEYPIFSEKGNEDEPNNNSLYKEDGSLEVDFLSLIDARIFYNGGLASGTELHGSECAAGNENTPETVLPGGNNLQTVALNPETVELNQQKETELPPPDIDGTSIWDQISESLSAKKEQLSKENGWGMTPKKVQPLQETKWGKNAKNAVPSPKSNWGKNAKNAQPLPKSSWGKNTQKAQPSKEQSSGSKSWSYKAIRGSALGPTMAMLRSKNDA